MTAIALAQFNFILNLCHPIYKLKFYTRLECRTNSTGANWDVRRTGRNPNRKEAMSSPEARDGLHNLHPCNLDTGTPCRYDGVFV
ncbi:MAG: hypothetical protein ACXWTK_06685 [Methylobacter sp.]